MQSKLAFQLPARPLSADPFPAVTFTVHSPNLNNTNRINSVSKPIRFPNLRRRLIPNKIAQCISEPALIGRGPIPLLPIFLISLSLSGIFA